MHGDILVGDVRAVLPTLEAESVQMCVTSPPYFGLRDYGTAEWEGGADDCDHAVRKDPRSSSSTLGGGKATTGHQREGFKDECRRCGAKRIDQQIGLEPTVDEYVAQMVAVFRDVRRVLKADGTLWLNLGDSYNAYNGNRGKSPSISGRVEDAMPGLPVGYGLTDKSLGNKQLLGVPWRVAFALQADGWILRQEIIWSKPNPMPESVTDRCTKSHEQIFLLSKQERYFYDAAAIAEPATCDRMRGPALHPDLISTNGNSGLARRPMAETRNKRSVWEVATQSYSDAHFATFPEALIEPCILAGSRPGDTVLDPFLGSGTTGAVCERLGRNWIGVELNPAYADLARKRTAQRGMALA